MHIYVVYVCLCEHIHKHTSIVQHRGKHYVSSAVIIAVITFSKISSFYYCFSSSTPNVGLELMTWRLFKGAEGRVVV